MDRQYKDQPKETWTDNSRQHTKNRKLKIYLAH